MAAHLDLEEQEQLDQLKAFWAKWGNLLTWLLIAVLGAYAAWNGWNYWQRKQSLQASALYEELERAVKSNDATRVERVFTDLRDQVTTAYTLGARKSAILFEILWPQAAGPVLRAAGLGALWASGDFAVSGILLGPGETLPLVIEDLLGHYRLESATVLLWPLAAVGLSLYFVFTRARRYVVD